MVQRGVISALGLLDLPFFRAETQKIAILYLVNYGLSRCRQPKKMKNILNVTKRLISVCIVASIFGQPSAQRLQSSVIPEAGSVASDDRYRWIDVPADFDSDMFLSRKNLDFQKNRPITKDLVAANLPNECKWTQSVPFPTNIAANAVVEHRGKIYSFGGARDATNSGFFLSRLTHEFDGKNWIEKAKIPYLIYLSTAVSDGRYIYLINGSGVLPSGGPLNPLAILLRYDPVNDTWDTLKPPEQATNLHASAFVDGKIFRVVGNNNGSQKHAEVYFPDQNIWRPLPSYPLAITAGRAIGYKNSLYVAGGYISENGNLVQQDKTYRYDWSLSKWVDADIQDLPAKASGRTSAMIGRNWVLVGDFFEGGATGGVYIWDAEKNTWSKGPDLPLIRYYMQGAFLNNALYVIGGDIPSTVRVGTTTVQKLEGCSLEAIGSKAYVSAILLNKPGTNGEVEPNDTSSQASGPLISGVVFTGQVNDEKDYWRFEVAKAGKIKATLTVPPGPLVQLQLWYKDTDNADNRVVAKLESPFEIEYDVPADRLGTYYLYVATDAATLNPDVSYSIQVNLP